MKIARWHDLPVFCLPNTRSYSKVESNTAPGLTKKRKHWVYYNIDKKAPPDYPKPSPFHACSKADLPRPHLLHHYRLLAPLYHCRSWLLITLSTIIFLPFSFLNLLLPLLLLPLGYLPLLQLTILQSSFLVLPYHRRNSFYDPHCTTHSYLQVFGTLLEVFFRCRGISPRTNGFSSRVVGLFCLLYARAERQWMHAHACREDSALSLRCQGGLLLDREGVSHWAWLRLPLQWCGWACHAEY